MTHSQTSLDQDLRTALKPDHELKSHPDVFWPAARGEKTFEFRKDDRPGGFHLGQTVRLRCYDRGGYVEVEPLDRRITNILRGGEFGLQEGYCVLSLAPLTAPPRPDQDSQTPLWCMHIAGPDDLHAAPDFWTALAWAAELNGFLAKRAIGAGWAQDDNWSLTQATVKPWPYSADEHDRSLAKELAERAAHEARRTAPPRPDHAGGVLPQEIRDLHRDRQRAQSMFDDGEGSWSEVVAAEYRLDMARKQWVGQLLSTPAQAPDKAAEREGVAPMPPCDDRELQDPAKPDGYLESADDWAERNSPAINWLIENHAAIRAALAPKPTGTEAGRGVGAVPVGWKLVPSKLTYAMADDLFRTTWPVPNIAAAQVLWDAMLAATPTPPTPDSTGPAGDDLRLLQQAAKAGRLRIERRKRLADADPDAGMVWPIEVELPCINGLSAWFTLGNIYSPDRAAQGYTDGALSDDLAGAFAAHIVQSLAALTPSAPIAAPVRDDGVTKALAELDAKATPGRWVFERMLGSDFAGVYSDDATGSVLARFNGFAWAPRPDSEADANGQFVAALVNVYRSGVLASRPAPAGDVPGEAQTQAARDVLAERRRQVEAEGWTPEHDDAHGKGEIARAAATYAMAGAMQTSYLRDNFLGEWVNYKFSDVRSQWPGSWDWLWFKPSHPRRDLVKAAALILAEIERLDRSSGEAQTTPDSTAQGDAIKKQCAEYGGLPARCLITERNWAPGAKPKRCALCPDAAAQSSTQEIGR